MRKEHIVIIGAGMAGSKLAYELSHLDGAPFQVTLIGEEAQVGYNRIMLSSLLAQDVTEAEVALVDVSAMAHKGAHIISGDPVLSVDLDAKSLRLASNQCVTYDRLVFATGARSFLPHWAQVESDNVVGFRDWQDVKALLSLASGSRVVVIGGGLLGLEAAVGLARNGHQAIVLQRSDRILNRQLDEKAACLLHQELQHKGVQCITGISPYALRVDPSTAQVTHVLANEGRAIPADMVVVAAGIAPEVNVAKQCGLAVDRAILVNAKMQTSHNSVYALGECSQFNQHTFGLVAPIWDQLEVLIHTLLGEDAEFSVKPISTKLKVSGVDLFSIGQIDSAPEQAITLFDPVHHHYRKLVVNDDHLVGAILYGNVADGGWYSQLIQNKTDISSMLESLAFGESYCQIT